MSIAVTAVAAGASAIALRTRGQAHGPLTRLMSPGDLGQVLKPVHGGRLDAGGPVDRWTAASSPCSTTTEARDILASRVP